MRTSAETASGAGRESARRLKLLTLPALLAALLFSVIVVVPFSPNAKTTPRVSFLEARFAASVAGHAKIYYDTGSGYNEAQSVELALEAPGTMHTYRFSLPAGTYRSIRFDPIESAGQLTLEAPLRIVSDTGRALLTVPFAQIKPLQQIASLRLNAGKLEIVAAAPADDPQLGITFSPPFVADLGWIEFLRFAAPRSLAVFVALVLVLLGLERAPRVRDAAVATAHWSVVRPKRAIALSAALAVIASAYPVVFLGKSHVSPNFGTMLLYEYFPSLPGYASNEVSPTNGADIGAAMFQHVPYGFMQRRALAQGELPLWNRYTLTGAPLLAQAQSMFGDPLQFLVLLCDGASWAWDVKYLLAKWLFACGVGLVVLTAVGTPLRGVRPASQPQSTDVSERRPYQFVPALLVATTAPFVGFYVFRINHPAIFTLGYAPWVLLCWIRLAHATARREIALWNLGLFLANFALMNSGTVKEAYVLLMQMNASGAALLLASAVPWRARLARLADAVWIGAILLLVTAPLWGTFLDALRNAFTVSTHATADQIQPALLLGAFDELFWRPLSKGDIVFNPSLNVFLLLGGLYFLATLRLHFREPVLMATAACTALWMAIVFGAVPPAWIARLPLLGNVGHVDNCLLCGLLVLWPILAAAGFRAAAQRLRTPEGRGDLIVAGVLLAALVVAWLGFRQAAHRSVYGPGVTFSVVAGGQPIAVSAFIWGSLAVLLLASVGLALVARHAFGRGAFGPAGAILAALCIAALLWRHGLQASNVGFENYVVRPPARAPFGRPSPAIDYLQAAQRTEPGRVFGLHGNLAPAWNAVYGLEAIHGPDALQHVWLRDLIDVSPVKWSSSWRVYLASQDIARARPFLDVLNVRYYVDLASNPPAVDPALSRVKSADLEVYESRTAWPRAFFTNALAAYTAPTELMSLLLAQNGRPLAAALRVDIDANRALAALPHDPAARTVAPATHYQLTANTTSFDVHADGPGVIVLHEALWPDTFRAELNGRRAPIVRINHAFRGLVVDAAGDYHVAFRYWPRHFTRYLTLSGLGVLLGAISLLFALRPARAA